MKKLICRELLPRDCDWELVGTDEDDVLARAREHARKMHGVQLGAEEEQRARALIRNW